MRKLRLEKQVSIHELRQLKLSLAICGFKAQVKDVESFLKRVEEVLGESLVQVVDGEFVLSEKVVLAALINSLTYSGKKWISSPKIRFLAFLACEKQIKDVFSKVGLREGLRDKLLLIVASKLEPRQLLEKIEDFYLKTGYQPVDLREIFSKSREEVLNVCKAYGISEDTLSILGGELIDSASKLIMEKMSMLKLRI